MERRTGRAEGARWRSVGYLATIGVGLFVAGQWIYSVTESTVLRLTMSAVAALFVVKAAQLGWGHRRLERPDQSRARPAPPEGAQPVTGVPSVGGGQSEGTPGQGQKRNCAG
jgi:hypothetical protein